MTNQAFLEANLLKKRKFSNAVITMKMAPKRKKTRKNVIIGPN